MILWDPVTQRMVESAPEYYLNSRIYGEIQQVIAQELIKIDTDAQDLKLQLYVRTATWGLKYWEEALGIKVIEQDNYDIRRSRVLGKLRGIGNFSAALVHSIAAAYTDDVVNVGIDIPNFEVLVEFIEDFPNTNDFKYQLEEIIHAHMGYRYRSKMKETTKPRNDWKQIVDDFTLNIDFATNGWGGSEFRYDGTPRYDGDIFYNGGRLGPKHIISESLKMGFEHEYQIIQQPTSKIKSAWQHSTPPVQHSTGFVIDMHAFFNANRIYNGLGEYNGDGNYGAIFLYHDTATKLRVAYSHKALAVVRKESFKINVSEKSPIKTAHKIANKTKLNVRSGALFYDGKADYDGTDGDYRSVLIYNNVAVTTTQEATTAVPITNKETSKVAVSFPTTLKADHKLTNQVKLAVNTGAAHYDGFLSYDGKESYSRILVNQKAVLQVVKNNVIQGEYAV